MPWLGGTVAHSPNQTGNMVGTGNCLWFWKFTPQPSNILPLARLHLLHLPKQLHQLGFTCSKIWAYKGHSHLYHNDGNGVWEWKWGGGSSLVILGAFLFTFLTPARISSVVPVGELKNGYSDLLQYIQEGVQSFILTIVSCWVFVVVVFFLRYPFYHFRKFVSFLFRFLGFGF